MIKGGTGGANTNKTGLKFEKDTSLAALLSANGFEVLERPKGPFDLIVRDGVEIGVSAKGAKLYKLLDSLGLDHNGRLSKRLWPDEALFISNTRTLYIIEKKFMQVAGSVDEKPQTADFKKKQYLKLVSGSDIAVEFMYVFNASWWDKPEYRDTFEYIHEVGCRYFFDEIPLSAIGLAS